MIKEKGLQLRALHTSHPESLSRGNRCISIFLHVCLIFVIFAYWQLVVGLIF